MIDNSLYPGLYPGLYPVCTFQTIGAGQHSMRMYARFSCGYITGTRARSYSCQLAARKQFSTPATRHTRDGGRAKPCITYSSGLIHCISSVVHWRPSSCAPPRPLPSYGEGRGGLASRLMTVVTSSRKRAGGARFCSSTVGVYAFARVKDSSLRLFVHSPPASRSRSLSPLRGDPCSHHSLGPMAQETRIRTVSYTHLTLPTNA